MLKFEGRPFEDAESREYVEDLIEHHMDRCSLSENDEIYYLWVRGVEGYSFDKRTKVCRFTHLCEAPHSETMRAADIEEFKKWIATD